MIELSSDMFSWFAFDWTIVAYFFLGGLSAGIYFFSVAANYWKKEFKPLAKRGAVLAPVFLAIGMLLLLIHLGKPFRAWRLFTTFVPTAAASWGVWFLNIFFVLSAGYAWFLIKGKDETAKKFAYPGLVFAFLVSTYTGLLLSQASGRALWHTALLPWMFLVGGLVSGAAVMILISAKKENSAILAKLGRFIAWLILLELGMIATEMIVLYKGGAQEVITVKSLLSGSHSFFFWGVEIFLGAIVPAVILFRKKTNVGAQAIASILILIGIYMMRYIVVIGG